MNASRTTHRSTVIGVTTLVVALATACDPSGATALRAGTHVLTVPAVASGDDTTKVDVLDLSGVDPGELAALPAPDSVPLDDASIGPAASSGGVVLPAAEPVPSPSATPSPGGPAANRAMAGRPEPDVLTRPMATSPFSVLGLTWDDDTGLAGVVIRYRVRVDGSWTRWQGIEASDVAPDPGTSDAAHSGSRGGTDPIVAVGGDGLQVWAEAGSGAVHHLKAVLVDPGSEPADASPAAADDGTGVVRSAALERNAVMAQPTILSRAAWGADESLRTCTPDYSTSMVSAAVHHTASTNSYSEADVPGLIRGFYAYHTRPEAQGGRGWCDIGYNFLVDKFGRIWEGRADSATTTVIGVHTGGFNSRTVGVAAIGDYSTTAPSSALLEGLSQIIAWRFTALGILAGTSVTMTSGGGASKYPEGTVVTFPTIYGHRDAQLTACPGQRLYDALPAIRARVAQLANATVAASPRGSIDRLVGTPTTVSTGGWAFDQDSSAALTVAVTIDGATTNLSASGPRPDVAAAFGVGSNHGFDAQLPTADGQHLVCLTAKNVNAGRDVMLGCRLVTVKNHLPTGSVDTVVQASPTSITVAGWALDPDTTASINVHVYLDGTLAEAPLASGARPDVGRAFGDGDAHGFYRQYTVTTGSHQVCVYAMDSLGHGPNPLLACRTITTS